MRAFVWGHPWIASFVVLTIVTAMISYRGGERVVTVGDREFDMRAPMAILMGIVWQFYWAEWAVERIFGRDRLSKAVQRWYARRGTRVELSWRPWQGCSVSIPGVPSDYPCAMVPAACIRAGRMVGVWGVLLAEIPHELQVGRGRGPWFVVARKQGAPGFLADDFPEETAARQFFVWTTEAHLESELAKALPPPEAPS